MADGAEDLRLWDAAAGGYADRADSFYRRVHGFLWDRLGTVQGLDVFDLGCGDGWLAEEMRLAGARVTGIDGSAALLAMARSQYPQVAFEQLSHSEGNCPNPRLAGPSVCPARLPLGSTPNATLANADACTPIAALPSPARQAQPTTRIVRPRCHSAKLLDVVPTKYGH